MQHADDIYGGRSPRDLALYSVADAARVVQLPPATTRAWAFGRVYRTQSGEQKWPPLIQAADPKNRRLSFTNLVELHVLSALRDWSVRVDRIRSATKFIRDQMRTQHPLADVDTQTDQVDVYVEFLGKLVNASTAQAQLRPIVACYLTRIDRDAHGLALRLFPLTREGHADAPRLVVIDPARRFGRPVLATANVETAIIAERFQAGDSTSTLAADFGVGDDAIEEALRFENRFRRAA